MIDHGVHRVHRVKILTNEKDSKSHSVNSAYSVVKISEV